MRRYLLLFFLLPITNSFSQSPEPPILFKDDKIVLNMSKDTVLLDSLIAISRRYGVEKNFNWGIDSSALSGRYPIKIAFGLNLVQFEGMAKRLAFNEKHAEILRQFFEKDFQECSTGREYIALKRAYLKKYPEYLKNEAGFREEDLKRDEAVMDKMILNTEKYREAHKN
ncbi:hypothetical protein [Salmonirosea aquatica]|uniref:Uncharacterized protein n=1 Tax=Salmonirosea aquatica TaxID=2654236 RepID=A0A7C9FC32_9BACT|nr:hypothetical protein [Cytophagaceae bacterium SJW1-29]